LRGKQSLVRDAFGRFDTLRLLDVPELGAAEPIVGYRTRAKLVANAQGSLGLYAAGTHDVIDLPECVVLEPLVARVVAALRALLRVTPLLSGVDVVRVEAGVLVTLIADPAIPEHDLEAFLRDLRRGELCVVGIALSRRAPDAVQLLGTDLKVLWGAESALRRLAVDMPYYRVAHGGFVQAHDGTAAAVQRSILASLERIGPLRDLRVLELYAGAGSLSLWLAEKGARVVAVESFKPACERLERTARAAQLELDVVGEDAARGLQRLSERGARFDAVVVNPPRRGLDVRVREAIGKLRPESVSYVSCEPSTLARDLAHFANLGLTVQRLQPFDMIPLTNQVETLAELVRAERPVLSPVYEDAEIVAFDKPAYVALSELNLPDEHAGAMPLSALPKEYSGLALFARDPRARERLVAALDLTLELRVLARGVTHARGELGRSSAERLRYVRTEVVGGHSLLDVRAAALNAGFERAFSLVRHPLVGAQKQGDRRTNQHFLMRHGLDRAFVHVSELNLTVNGKRIELSSPLAPDLTLVLDSLRA